MRLLEAVPLVIGVAVLTSKVFAAFIQPVWYFHFRPPTSFEAYRRDWAVVTGASEGLGRGYALALAKRGLHVALLARNEDKLKAVAAECRAIGVEAKVIVADFATEAVEDLCAEIRIGLGELDGDVSVLINNVGGNLPPSLPRVPMPCYCESLDSSTSQSFFRFNSMPSVFMTQMLLQGMVNRNRGYILNVSSMNALQSCPYLGPYCAAKAYVKSYAACLNAELKGRQSRVRVEVVCPGPVATKGIGRAGMPSSGVPDPVNFADMSLNLARTAFVEVPWAGHWWSTQSFGPNSHFISNATAEAKLRKSMDYSRLLGPPGRF